MLQFLGQFQCVEYTMIIHSASQLLTISGPPQRGHDLGRLEIIDDGAILVRDETIAAVGKSEELLKSYPDEKKFDASEGVIIPGFVDPHTHVVWAGERSSEFEMRVRGASYLEIMASGGGIASTVQETRAAGIEQLMAETRPRLRRMFKHGTTTAEVKTGYGLNTETELRLIKTILKLDIESPIELIPTFLGAHAIPVEFNGDVDGYTEIVCSEMLPKLKSWWLENRNRYPFPFVDVFCESGVFSLEQSRRILEKARDLGFPLKIHADEFQNLGGVTLAVSLGAASADHIVVTSQKDITVLGQSDTVGVSLPCTPFGLAEGDYTPAKEILDANGILAIATDINPGTAWCENMQFAIALACRYLKLTPAQAIVAATLNAAAAVQREEFIGSIEEGKQADILILDVPDYRHLGYRFGTNLVHSIVKKGEFYRIDGGEDISSNVLTID